MRADYWLQIAVNASQQNVINFGDQVKDNNVTDIVLYYLKKYPTMGFILNSVLLTKDQTGFDPVYFAKKVLEDPNFLFFLDENSIQYFLKIPELSTYIFNHEELSRFLPEYAIKEYLDRDKKIEPPSIKEQFFNGDDELRQAELQFTDEIKNNGLTQELELTITKHLQKEINKSTYNALFSSIDSLVEQILGQTLLMGATPVYQEGINTYGLNYQNGAMANLEKLFSIYVCFGMQEKFYFAINEVIGASKGSMIDIDTPHFAKEKILAEMKEHLNNELSVFTDNQRLNVDYKQEDESRMLKGVTKEKNKPKSFKELYKLYRQFGLEETLEELIPSLYVRLAENSKKSISEKEIALEKYIEIRKYYSKPIHSGLEELAVLAQLINLLNLPIFKNLQKSGLFDFNSPQKDIQEMRDKLNKTGVSQEMLLVSDQTLTAKTKAMLVYMRDLLNKYQYHPDYKNLVASIKRKGILKDYLGDMGLIEEKRLKIESTTKPLFLTNAPHKTNEPVMETPLVKNAPIHSHRAPMPLPTASKTRAPMPLPSPLKVGLFQHNENTQEERIAKEIISMIKNNVGSLASMYSTQDKTNEPSVFNHISNVINEAETHKTNHQDALKTIEAILEKGIDSSTSTKNDKAEYKRLQTIIETLKNELKEVAAKRSPSSPTPNGEK